MTSKDPDLLQIGRRGEEGIAYVAAVINMIAAGGADDGGIAIYLNMTYGNTSNYGQEWKEHSIHKFMFKHGYTYRNSVPKKPYLPQTSIFLRRMKELIGRGYDSIHIARYLNKIDGDSGWNSSKVWEYIEANNLAVCSATQ
jgi:hypothetical protein